MSEDIIHLNNSFSTKEIEQFNLFDIKCVELSKNWDSLIKSGLRLGGNFTNHEDGTISGPGCGVEIHRLKGLYLDFRFFHADKEPTNYFKIANLVGGNCDDGRIRLMLKRDRKVWNDSGLLKSWHGYTADQLIRTLFNGHYFHSVDEERLGAKDIYTVLGSDVANHELTYCIFHRMRVVRRLNWICEPIRLGQKYIRLNSDWLVLGKWQVE